MSDAHPHGNPIRVLLVDDHAMVRQGLRCALEVYPAMEVVGEASDGIEALECVAKVQPSVVVMDIVMPKMDGFEAVKKLRDNSQTRSVPIVMVTSKGEAESMEAGYENGCSDYILKPIDRLELLAKVKNLLGE